MMKVKTSLWHFDWDLHDHGGNFRGATLFCLDGHLYIVICPSSDFNFALLQKSHELSPVHQLLYQFFSKSVTKSFPENSNLSLKGYTMGL